MGAVTFQVPLTVKVAKIEWPDRGLGGAPAEWLTGPWAIVKAYYQPATAWRYDLPGLRLAGRSGRYRDLAVW